jgi:hypothetical protein
MALGVKTKPTPEVGDLIFAKLANQFYYDAASLDAETVKIARTDLKIGQILFISSLIKDGPDSGTWITVKEENTSATVYVPLDEAKYTVQANSEYAYDSKTKFNWSGLLTGLGTAISTALGIFNSSKEKATPIGEEQAKRDAIATPTLLEWLKANILLVITLPLVVVLAIILMKFVFKKQPNNQSNNTQATGLGSLFKCKKK